jgi:hypothetical protein
MTIGTTLCIVVLANGLPLRHPFSTEPTTCKENSVLSWCVDIYIRRVFATEELPDLAVPRLSQDIRCIKLII